MLNIINFSLGIIIAIVAIVGLINNFIQSNNEDDGGYL
jgi:hypothetical protein